MIYFLIILAFLYAICMGYAALSLISLSKQPCILIFNLSGAIFIFFYLVDYRFLYAGVIILFFSALLNGYFILNKLNFMHILIRFIFSGFLCLLTHYIHAK